MKFDTGRENYNIITFWFYDNNIFMFVTESKFGQFSYIYVKGFMVTGLSGVQFGL